MAVAKHKLTPEEARRAKHMQLARQNLSIRMTWMNKVRGGVQNVATPLDTVCYPMIELHDDPKVLDWVVLFNLEFIEALIFKYHVPPSQLYYAFDNNDEAALALNLYGLPPRNLMQLDESHIKMGAIDKLNEVFELEFNAMALNKENAIIIGNPPYQEMDGGNQASAKPLYHKFIEQAIDSGVRYVSMVVPSRWMAGGKGLDKFRARMMADKSLKVIRDFKGAKQVFPSVDIAGGVCYFLRDAKHTGDCNFNGFSRDLSEYDVLVRDELSIQILKKVKGIHLGDWLAGFVSPRNPYGLLGDTKPASQGTPCIFKQSIGRAFVDPGIVRNPRGDLNTWRLLVPYAPIAGQTDFTKQIAIFNDRILIEAAPGEACTETYIVLRSFSSKPELDNFKAYVKTRFFRFMLLLRVVSQHITSGSYLWVPDLGSYVNLVTDADLYTMFGISPAHVAHIEATIKEI